MFCIIYVFEHEMLQSRWSAAMDRCHGAPGILQIRTVELAAICHFQLCVMAGNCIRLAPGLRRRLV
jgi:hypothetical protein